MDVERRRTREWVVGERRLACCERIVSENEPIEDRRQRTVGAPVGLPYVPATPSAVPVLFANVELSNDTAGERTTLAVTNGRRVEEGYDPFVELRTDGGADANEVYAERYLTECDHATGVQSDLAETRWVARARVSGGTGLVRAGSTVGLLYEVV